MILAGKRIIVTGAAGGLGFDIVTALVAAKAEVIAVDINASRAEDFSALGVKFYHVDLASTSSVDAFAANFTHIDGLVNNGAIATNVGGMTFDMVDEELFTRVLNVNVMGIWRMVKALKLQLKNGFIVNIASDTALWGAPKLLSYTASKGAVMSMTRSLSRELGEDNIAITCLAPGILKTPSTEYVPEARHKLYEEGRAIKGVQTTEDIVLNVLHLLTPAARALTGQTLAVNRGFVFT